MAIGTKMRISKKSTVTFLFFIGVFSPMLHAQNDKTLESYGISPTDIIESARKITPKNIEGETFNEFGLVYPKGSITLEQIKAMSAEQLQKYADIVIHAYPDAISKQLPLSCKEIPISRLNEASIAGIAYISLNAVEEESRMHAKECLKEIKNKL